MPAGLAGFWVIDPSKLHCPAYCLLSVKSGTQRRNLPPNFRMWRPVTQVTLSVTLPDLQVLGLRPLIEGRAVHRGVAAPGEVGERAADAGPRGLLEAAHAGALVLVRALQERLRGRRPPARS